MVNNFVIFKFQVKKSGNTSQNGHFSLLGLDITAMSVFNLKYVYMKNLLVRHLFLSTIEFKVRIENNSD